MDDPQDVLGALVHPTRRKVLKVAIESAGDDADVSPKEIAEVMDEPLSNVGYHVRVLVNAGLLALERTEPVRGSLKHYYRPTSLVDSPLVRQALELSGGDD